MAKKKPKQGSNRSGVKSGPKAKKTGPKETPIDWGEVDYLASIYCTQDEIAAFVGMSVDTLAIRYRSERKEKPSLGEWMEFLRGKGRASLRRKQYQAAINGDSERMLIWLGKQWLGQADKREESLIIDAKAVETIELTEATLNTWIEAAK
jgi:hypothetical protein